MCEMTDGGVPERKPHSIFGKTLFGVIALPFVGTYVLLLTLGYLVFVPFVVLTSLMMIFPEMIYLGLIVLPLRIWRRAVFGEDISFPEIVSTEMLMEGFRSMWESYSINIRKIFFR